MAQNSARFCVGFAEATFIWIASSFLSKCETQDLEAQPAWAGICDSVFPPASGFACLCAAQVGDAEFTVSVRNSSIHVEESCPGSPAAPLARRQGGRGGQDGEMGNDSDP